LLKFLDVARIQPIIDRKFPLKDAAAAQQRMEEGKQFGKILLQNPD
jgi:NADPH:quinone reductase-like Zn-dependent oxidoreductase